MSSYNAIAHSVLSEREAEAIIRVVRFIARDPNVKGRRVAFVCGQGVHTRTCAAETLLTTSEALWEGIPVEPMHPLMHKCFTSECLFCGDPVVKVTHTHHDGNYSTLWTDQHDTTECPIAPTGAHTGIEA